MENNFDKILESLLMDFEKNPNQDIDNFIQSLKTKYSLNPQDMHFLSETLGYLDGFEKEAASLSKVPQTISYRKDWLLERLDSIMEGRSEEEKAQIVTAVSERESEVLSSLNNDN